MIWAMVKIRKFKDELVFSMQRKKNGRPEMGAPETCLLFSFPTILSPRSLCGPQGKPADVASYYQLALGVERMRAPEVLFQPSMVGIDQSGLSDCLEYVLQYYPADVQQRLVEVS